MVTNRPQKTAKKILQKYVPLLVRGHRGEGTENRPASLAQEGFLRGNPFCPPTPFGNF